MIALLFSLILDYRVPVDYYYSEPTKISIDKVVTKKEKRREKWKPYR